MKRHATVFRPYIPLGGGERVYAAEITTEESLEISTRQWKLENAKLGDFIILQPNGGVQIYGELDFGESYELAS